MKIIILAAIGSNYAIGKNGALPWQGEQRGDMARFVQVTKGFPIIVGRRTYESFTKKPLPNRTNIVITRCTNNLQPGCIMTNSLEGAVATAKQEGKEKVFIVGGAEIYRQAISLADELDVTLIYHEFQADTFFPVIDPMVWRETRRSEFPSDEKNKHSYAFIGFERIRTEGTL